MYFCNFSNVFKYWLLILCLILQTGEEESKREPTPEPEQDYTEDDLPKLQDDVNNLQQQFDLSVTEKHNLETELTSMNQRLKAATDLIDR